MKIFITGGSGFIGSAIVCELVQAGHEVTGLARSDASAQALRDAGTAVYRGDLSDLDTLTAGARASEGVVHVGFVHDFTKYKQMCELDRQVIGALGRGLEGSDKPLVAAAATVTAFGERGVETDRYPPGASETIPRAASEEAVDALVERGVRAGIVRLSPSVHGEGDRAFVPMLIEIAQAKGVSAYIGDGKNRWNAVHRLDAAQVFARAVERLQPGERFHAVAESEIAFRDIAIAIAELLDLPVRSISADEAESHFGSLHWAVALDCPTESWLTRERLDWSPTHPTLLDDLRSGIYAS
ncbi:MAG: SDR family oxidoreductase [Myxococcota bacterium]